MKLSKSLKILLVDDSSDMRILEKTLLSKTGFNNIISAENGKKALEMLGNEHQVGKPVELILADWNMPEMDGLTFFQKLKETNYTKDIPFILVTNESERDRVLSAINSGITSYIVKPITGNTLLNKIVEVMNENKE